MFCGLKEYYDYYKYDQQINITVDTTSGYTNRYFIAKSDNMM